MINHPKLNLACGTKHKDGFCNIDYQAIEGVDEVVDLLDFPWPIESESAEKIICAHFVEHIPHDLVPYKLLKIIRSNASHTLQMYTEEMDTRDGLIQFMDEVYRILKPEGTIDITTPYYSSETMWRDPTHCRAITDVTYHYFNKKWRDNSGLSHYNIKSNFEVVPHNYELHPGMANKSEETRMKGIMYNINVVAHITMRLTKY
jgi:predicted SAM-dependent methyltransferase